MAYTRNDEPGTRPTTIEIIIFKSVSNRLIYYNFYFCVHIRTYSNSIQKTKTVIQGTTWPRKNTSFNNDEEERRLLYIIIVCMELKIKISSVMNY